jgi:hypothetical protein
MAQNDSTSSGSAPPVGEIVTEASGGRPRTPKRAERVSGVTLDGTRSPETDLANDAARAAQAAYNSGAADAAAGGISDPAGMLDRTRAPVSSGGSSDPSSLASHSG